VTATDDEPLLMRLRDLALVDLDALLTGAEGTHYAELLTGYGDDLEDALCTARARAGELQKTIMAGDPLQLLESGFAARARDGGRDAAERAARKLVARSTACRQLARLDDLAAGLYPRLVEADRRRASLGT
jgi:hypothetical protein